MLDRFKLFNDKQKVNMKDMSSTLDKSSIDKSKDTKFVEAKL